MVLFQKGIGSDLRHIRLWELDYILLALESLRRYLNKEGIWTLNRVLWSVANYEGVGN
jgi:hypothetical protein